MNIEEIVSKEGNGEKLDQAEKKHLKLWLEEDPKNQKIYAQLKLSILYPDDKEMDAIESRVWTDLRERIPGSTGQKGSAQKFSWIYKVAAIVVLGLFSTFLIIEISSGTESDTQLVEVRMIEKVSTTGQKITTTLPDGTKVKLNSESKLIVPEKFASDRREVELTGEAFFEVVENSEAPFIIRSGDMEVKVLGTSFNVRAYQDESTLKVGVKTGKVEVKGIEASGEQVVTLLPNDLSTWEPNTSLLGKERITEPDAVFGWTEQRLVFESRTFPEVLKTLSKWYGVAFTGQKEIQSAERTFTYKAQNPTLEEILVAVAHVYDFDFEINKTSDEVTLK